MIIDTTRNIYKITTKTRPDQIKIIIAKDQNQIESSLFYRSLKKVWPDVNIELLQKHVQYLDTPSVLQNLKFKTWVLIQRLKEQFQLPKLEEYPKPPKINYKEALSNFLNNNEFKGGFGPAF